MFGRKKWNFYNCVTQSNSIDELSWFIIEHKGEYTEFKLGVCGTTFGFWFR